ncbi:GTP cyclohydrolase I FolE2 [Desulfobulbus rhabdoformis]|jgi:GTP cyclohydrolase I|uniref:GTP cyclohydrolase I FolE2 n=1 Tax=Desulfobulbus rhabdoformis TaxID=34032 RepID=UPI001964C5D1|nr:GTP cyclohydrolase I FolE2 [Desulfobulbus rhabdoformis]MBM9613242.1 GTP cyclohydrolase I FolE2 [Desulfobulbus rhabdoformis]
MSLQSVGISDFTCPVQIPQKNGGMQQTVATMNLMAQIPKEHAASGVGLMHGILTRYLPNIHSGVFPELLNEVRLQLQADTAELVMHFPYFLKKEAPVTGTASLMEYQCSFSADATTGPEPLLTVRVPVTTLCPCSKEISTAGAHNQRAEVTLRIRPLAMIWLEDLISLVEACGSCEIYALLKRPDEKFVTERAYAQPMFVEDVVRMVAEQVMALADVAWFSVGVESFESIHNHSAYAYVDSDDLKHLT